MSVSEAVARRTETQTAILLDGALVQTIDDFIYAYPHLPGNRVNPDGYLEFPLPPRGDIVRFVRKHRSLFLYDDDTYQFPWRFYLWVVNRTTKMF